MPPTVSAMLGSKPMARVKVCLIFAVFSSPHCLKSTLPSFLFLFFVACAVGSYQPSLSSSPCTSCPLNSSTTSQQSTSISQCLCDPGYGLSGSSCLGALFFSFSFSFLLFIIIIDLCLTNLISCCSPIVQLVVSVLTSPLSQTAPAFHALRTPQRPRRPKQLQHPVFVILDMN